MSRQRLREFPTARVVALVAILCASFAALFHAGPGGAAVVCVALAGLAFAVAIVPPRRGRRASAGLCAVCAYDLTGNESGVCPECGTLVTKGVGP